MSKPTQIDRLERGVWRVGCDMRRVQGQQISQELIGANAVAAGVVELRDQAGSTGLLTDPDPESNLSSEIDPLAVCEVEGQVSVAPVDGWHLSVGGNPTRDFPLARQYVGHEQRVTRERLGQGRFEGRTIDCTREDHLEDERHRVPRVVVRFQEFLQWSQIERKDSLSGISLHRQGASLGV